MGSRPFAKTPGLEGGDGERGAGRQLRPRFSCPQCHARFSSSLELDSHICEAMTSSTQQRTRQVPTPGPSSPPTGGRRGRAREEAVRTRAMQRASQQQEIKEEEPDPAEPGPSTSTGGRTPAPRAHRCTLCEKSFSSPGKLYQHMYSHTGERPFACSQCSKAFSSKFKLMRHLLIHSADRKHQCPFCERSFHRKDHLKNHSKVHNPDKKVYRCEKESCRKEYNSFLSYRKHVAVHAAEDGGLDCKICGRNFSNREEILYHLKVHAGSRTVKNPSEKKFQCEHCERRFFTRKDVKRHLVVHTGKRDFLCQFCPQRFGRKDHLVRHIKKSHGVRGRTRRDLPSATETSPQPSTSGTVTSSPIPGPSGTQRRGTRRSTMPRMHVPTPSTITSPPLIPTPQQQMYPTQQPPPYPQYKLYPEASEEELGIKLEEDDEASVNPASVDPGAVDFNQLFQQDDFAANSGILDISLIGGLSVEEENQLMQFMGQSTSSTDHPIAGPSSQVPVVPLQQPNLVAPPPPPIVPPQMLHDSTALPCFHQAFQQPPPPPPPASQ